MNHSPPGLPIHHQHPESTQTHVHRVDDAILLSHPLLSTSPPALNLSQHQGLFQWVSSLHQVAKVSELQLQHQSFKWIFKFYFLSVQFSHSVVYDSLQPHRLQHTRLPCPSRKFAQTHDHWVGDAIPQSHPLLSTSPPALNLSQHQGLFQWVTSSYEVA